MSKPLVDVTFKEAWPPSSGDGDMAIKSVASDGIPSAGELVIGEEVDGAPQDLFDYLAEINRRG